MRLSAAKDAATEALQRETAELVEAHATLAKERLQLDADAAAITREAASARVWSLASDGLLMAFSWPSHGLLVASDGL